MAAYAANRMFGRITDESWRVAHCCHYFVAGIDAMGAADTLILQAIADVDPGRTHLYAELAIDAVAET
jgi:hypothetical protein